MFNGDATIGNNLNVNGELRIKGELFPVEKMKLIDIVEGGVLASVTENGKTGVRLSSHSDTNYGDIGSNAVDLSYSNKESTPYGATGTNSLASGLNTTASGTCSTAMGSHTTASGIESIAMGFTSTASASNSMAIGTGSTASAYNSMAMGFGTQANGMYSTAMGVKTQANGRNSTAMGNNTKARDYCSFVIGQYNDALSSVTSGGSEIAYNANNIAFVIGNGTAFAKSDAFKVKFNGDTTVSNNLTVSGDVVISSDARLKANIVSLGSTLSKLLLIDGKTYTMKKNSKQKIGVLAQDIQKVFPELVSKDENEMLAVNYQGLVPVLINALKEQHTKISRLEHLVNKLIADK